MNYIKLGNTGLDVSPICLGCMSFGNLEWRHKWLINEEESRIIIKRALDLGVNFFDRTNVYSYGLSEEYWAVQLKISPNAKRS
jgi:aryl-alcohol dehydrogenase-like predicted oxidoreductase